MKFSLSMALAGTIGAMAVLSSPSLARQGSGDAFTVDPVHSMVVFRIGHMGVSYAYGMIWQPTGSYTLDFANPGNSSLTIVLDTEKVDTGNERRDNHLRSPDFFNSKQYPKLTFEATSFEMVGENQMRVEGELTMIGQTKPVTAMVEFVDEGDTPQGHKSGFEAECTIKRSDFGMKFMLGGLGDEVTLMVGIEGIRQ